MRIVESPLLHIFAIVFILSFHRLKRLTSRLRYLLRFVVIQGPHLDYVDCPANRGGIGVENKTRWRITSSNQNPIGKPLGGRARTLLRLSDLFSRHFPF